MRYLIDCNPLKRGCYYCSDVVLRKNEQGTKRKYCIHDKCPYHELDNVEKYTEYDKQVRKQANSPIEVYLKKLFSL